jgi:hypothetical protein
MDKQSIQNLYYYTDNNPLMATMICEADLKTAAECFNIYDRTVFKKILFGRGTEIDNIDEIYTAVRAFSLFSYFGFPNIELDSLLNDQEKNEIVEQSNFISSDICKPPISIERLNPIFYELKRRGVVNRKGRYYEVRPNSLAYQQASEYIDRLTKPDEIINVLDKIKSVGLADPFCERFKFLDHNPNARIISERVFGENSPFGKAEVLNTELGSRLFRSLVEVNPEALLKTLVKLYLYEPVSELIKVDLGRRNLVWSLEILCFNNNTFNQAARILYRYAQAENESWSNNSRGIFKQLFRPYLSGTEADFNIRLEVLQYALSQPFVKDNAFLVDAITAAFEIQGASRMGGPEQQGTRVLKDFKPKTKLEILEYWREIIQLLKIVWENYPEFRGLIEAQFYLKSLQILSVDEPDIVTNFINWLESKDVSIPTSFYRSLERQLTFPRLPESTKFKIREFLKSREPQKAKGKFIRQVRDASYSPGKDRKGMDIDDTEVQVKVLARELWKQGEVITELIDLMLEGQQMYTEIFIQKYLSLDKQNDQRNRLWDLSIEKLKKIDPNKRNWAVLSGVLKSSSKYNKLNLLLSLGEIDGFEEIFLSLVNLHLNSVKELKQVWALIIRKGYSSESITKLRMGFFVFAKSFGVIRYICDKLKSLGDIGYWSALDILYRRIILKGIADDSEWGYCKKTFVEYDYFNLETKPKFIDLYNLVEISQRLAKKFTDTDFINIMTERLLNFLKTSHSVYYDDQFSELAVQLIEINFDEFWRKFSEALLSSDYFVYSAKNLFGSDHGNTGLAKDGILFADEGKWGQIIEWCKENSTKGPISIASLMPIYDHEGANLHPFAKMMIDEFGNNSDFLVTMSANLGSFGWVGSPIDYYEREKRLYEQLLERPNLHVKDFARKQLEILGKLIERQKLEEEERFLGL